MVLALVLVVHLLEKHSPAAQVLPAEDYSDKGDTERLWEKEYDADDEEDVVYTRDE